MLYHQILSFTMPFFFNSPGIFRRLVHFCCDLHHGNASSRTVGKVPCSGESEKESGPTRWYQRISGQPTCQGYLNTQRIVLDIPQTLAIGTFQSSLGTFQSSLMLNVFMWNQNCLSAESVDASQISCQCFTPSFSHSLNFTRIYFSSPLFHIKWLRNYNCLIVMVQICQYYENLFVTFLSTIHQ